MLSEATFLKSVEEFLERSKMTATAFGRDAVNDPSFVFDLRAGRSCSLRVVGQVNDYIAKRERDAA